jgi:signal transduction histidine kinase
MSVSRRCALTCLLTSVTGASLVAGAWSWCLALRRNVTDVAFAVYRAEEQVERSGASARARAGQSMGTSAAIDSTVHAAEVAVERLAATRYPVLTVGTRRAELDLLRDQWRRARVAADAIIGTGPADAGRLQDVSRRFAEVSAVAESLLADIGRRERLLIMLGLGAAFAAGGVGVAALAVDGRCSPRPVSAQRGCASRAPFLPGPLRDENPGTLAARLLEAEDGERRRIARELHDSIGQIVAALGMKLDTMAAAAVGMEDLSWRLAIEEAVALARDIDREIRTVSYLLHPPLLDESGLASALRWYANGFAARSGIAVHLELDEPPARPDPAVELALFRVVQEALTNVYRHSGSARAVVRLAYGGERLVVEVEDGGRGWAPPPGGQTPEQHGVGIASMRERVRGLGGTLECRSRPGSGTLVRASVPWRGAGS